VRLGLLNPDLRTLVGSIDIDRAFGESKEKMWVLQNLMVLLTSGIFLGLFLSLAKDSFGE